MKKRLLIIVLLCCMIIGSYSVYADELDTVDAILGTSDYDTVEITTTQASALADIVGEDAELTLLSSIDNHLDNIVASSLFNVDGTQCSYFKSILSRTPFMDYVVTYDGSYDYILYYGNNFSDGDSVSYCEISRQSTGSYSYNYTVTFGTTTYTKNASVEYINTLEDFNAFQEIEQIKWEKILFYSMCVMLGLYILGKILFR